MSEADSHSNANPAVKSRRIFQAAFSISAAAVLASIPISASIQQPELPGITLVATGAVASFLAIRSNPSRLAGALVGLTFLMAILVAIHQLLHRFGTAHEWIEPPYFGVVVVYCVLALFVGARLFVRDRP